MFQNNFACCPFGLLNRPVSLRPLLALLVSLAVLPILIFTGLMIYQEIG